MTQDLIYDMIYDLPKPTRNILHEHMNFQQRKEGAFNIHCLSYMLINRKIWKEVKKKLLT